MDYKKILKEIKNWTGCEKQYWQAFKLLLTNKRLKEPEVKQFRAGLTCHTEHLVNSKMKELKDLCEVEIKKQNTEESTSETSEQTENSDIDKTADKKKKSNLINKKP